MAVTKITDAMRNVTAVDATKISGAVPSASLTNVDLSKLEYNQAILAFKVASANQLAKFSMVDQVIDEYQDATGIDAGASTNENAGGATTAKYFEGGATVTPTVTSSASTPANGAVDPTDSEYWIHTFLTAGSSSLVTDAATTAEYLVVGGGGGASGGDAAGGAGAGGFRTSFGSGNISGANSAVETDLSLVAATYTVVVGAGGVGTAYNVIGNQGVNSSIIGTGVNIVSLGGALSTFNTTPVSGGSGGGDGREGGARDRTAGAGEPNQGMAGGVTSPSGGGAGGGGAGAVGGNTAGLSSSSGGDC